MYLCLVDVCVYINVYVFSVDVRRYACVCVRICVSRERLAEAHSSDMYTDMSALQRKLEQVCVLCVCACLRVYMRVCICMFVHVCVYSRAAATCKSRLMNARFSPLSNRNKLSRAPACKKL